MRLTGVFILWVLSLNVNGQDNNYWARQYGSISSMLGGAVVGSHNDNGSIYYNPATLAFSDSIYISLSAGLYQTSQWKYTNAVAKDSNLTSLGFKRFPVSFFPAFNLKRGFKVGIIYLTRLYGNYRLHHASLSEADVLNNNNPVKLSVALDYSNDVEESWYGVSLSKKLNDHSSIGLIPFVSYRYQEYLYQYSADALLDSVNYKYLTTLVKKYVNYYNYKLIMKGGYYYMANHFSLGATVTLPLFSVLSDGQSSTRVYLNGYDSYIPQAPAQYVFIDEQDDLKANHKYPYTVSVGCKFIRPKCIFYLSAESFFKIDPYSILEQDSANNSFPAYPINHNLHLSDVTGEARFVTNVAAGFQFKIRKNKTYTIGVATDFNLLPKNTVGRVETISSSNWNIYHLSQGVDVNISRFKISLGLLTSYGLKRDNMQLANIPTASAENYLYGQRQNISNNSYWDLSVLLGLNF